MEKIINITTAGRVIPIQDSAYLTLKNYLDELHRMFAGETGRDEIIWDIESRIAELMAEELKKGAPAINDAHVEAIMNAMGRVEDFGEQPAEDSATKAASTADKPPHRRLLRNADDKILGGVCSGVAAYFNVDPALIRIVFGILSLGGWGTGILLYIALWILLPEAPQNAFAGRRLFRLREDKWIGGVCTGLGAYFGKDPLLFRVIFGLPLLGGVISGNFMPFGSIVAGSISGTFLLIYVLLWIVLPYATTAFDNMQMRGEKIDLDSIRRNVQSGAAGARDRMHGWSAEVRESAERLRTGAASIAGPAASHAASAIGRIIRAVFLFFGWTLAIALFFGLVAYLFGGGSSLVNTYLIRTESQHTLGWLVIALCAAVPLLALVTWLIRRTLRIRGGGRYMAAGFVLLWLAGTGCLIALGSSLSRDFRRAGESRTAIALRQPANGQLVVTVPGTTLRYRNSLPWLQGDLEGWDVTEDSMRTAFIEIRSTLSPDTLYHAWIHRRSRGRDQRDAEARASAIAFNAAMVPGTDSVLALDNSYSFAAEDLWRMQHIVVELQIPAGKRVRLDHSVSEHLSDPGFVHRRRIRRRNRSWDIEDWSPFGSRNMDAGKDYRMGSDGELIPAQKDDPYVVAAKPSDQDLPDDPARTDRVDSIDRVMAELRRQRERLREGD